MDKFDQQILTLLRNDARTPVTQIARAVNLSRTAVSERIRHLEQQGIIQGYHARIASPEAPSVRAFLELFYNESRCEDYVELIRAFPEVKRCCGISGETDMLVYIEAASMARLIEIRAAIENFHKMMRVKTHIIMKEWEM
ncbi:Lrp/AsnC family transcriptional regulator [Marinobacterium sp. D7]|uniref:Lrp/AsnC family transcriptional regulator n=1 Tax=Marinobacterium ramblicola TaxID=2849041 RepID=UPI001C2D44D7|nr:Lrp/AsnC family transcriptional regulator [Marinobacterium ramblicola]